MAVLPIVTGRGNPILRKKTTLVPKVTKEIKTLLADMHDTLKAAKGLGLAAPQVGSKLRLCLATIDGKVTALINPRIPQKSAKAVMDQEGCLSLPGTWLFVPRAEEITLTYMNERGRKQERRLKKMDARVVQHEVDHLDGKLIVDYQEKGQAVAAEEVLRVLEETTKKD